MMRQLIIAALICASLTVSTHANRVLRLDGGHVAIPHSESLNLTDGMTIEAFVKLDSGVVPNGEIFIKGQRVVRWAYGLEAKGPDFHLAFNRSSGTYGAIDSSVSTGQWTHVAVTIDELEHEINFYVDGILYTNNQVIDGTVNTSDMISQYPDPAYIGSAPGGSFFGCLDEVRVWSYPRPQSEIQANMGIPLSGTEPNLVGYWTFEDSTATDASTNANDGTFIDGATTVVDNSFPFDSDADGMQDWWEMEHFGDETSADPDDDPDGDAYTNLEEFQNGTDPNEFDVGPAYIWTAAEVGWKSVLGTNYQVQYCEDIMSPDWFPLYEIIGNGATITVFDSTRWNDKRYYRIAVTNDLNEGLVARYPFDGHAADVSGNGNHGTTNGGISFGPGQFVGGVQNDGSGYIQVPDSPSLDVSYITISAWVWLNSYPSLSSVIANRDDLSSSRIFSLEFDPSGRFGFYVSTEDSTWDIHINPTNVVSTGAWHHVAGVFHPSEGGSLWVDGVRWGSDVSFTGAMLTGDSPLFVTGHSASPQGVVGTVDDVRIYGRALSSNEVQRLYLLQN